MVLLSGESYQHNKRVREGLTLVSHPLEVYGPSQAKAMFHLCLALKDVPSARRLRSPRRGSLPTDPLDVVIDLDRKLGAAATAATAQNFTAISSGHSLTETVHTHAAANFGLVCSFCRHSLLPLYSDNNKNHAVQLLERHGIIP